MSSVFHVEPLYRPRNGPIYVGHEEMLTYGEHRDEDMHGDLLIDPAVVTRIGCPLDQVDAGFSGNVIPFVKSIGYEPDTRGDGSLVYTETLHYLDGNKCLIPLKTTVRSGRSLGSRLSHLPSLNYVRSKVAGLDIGVRQAKHEIVSSLVENDSILRERSRHPVVEWIHEDLTDHLSKNQTVECEFSTQLIDAQLENFHGVTMHSPYDITPRDLRNILSTISPDAGFKPNAYWSNDVAYSPLGAFSGNMEPSYIKWKSEGPLNIEGIPNLEINAFEFRDIANRIDALPLTDLNVDILFDNHNQIRFVHFNVCHNRFGNYSGVALGEEDAKKSTLTVIDPTVLLAVVATFANIHRYEDPTIYDFLKYHSVKIKLIKTMYDEILILVFRADSKRSDLPMCGAYYDMALMSLAPLMVLPKIIAA